MELEDWGSRWHEGRIAFHQPNVNDLLAKHADEAWTKKLDRVLVPLCGKSLDMVFLADRADAVVGVEYVEQAAREFFAERGLQPQVGTGPPVRYTADGYTVVVSDFFAATNEHLGPIDAVFDRAALVALDAETRVKYANHVQSLVPAGARTLLITFDYDQAEMAGPPFAVPDGEVHRLFRELTAVEHVETREVVAAIFRERGVTAMTESAFVLTRL